MTMGKRYPLRYNDGKVVPIRFAARETTKMTGPPPLRVARMWDTSNIIEDRALLYDDAFFLMQKGLCHRVGKLSFSNILMDTFRYESLKLSVDDFLEFARLWGKARKLGARL